MAKPVSPKQVQDLRYKCQTDLFFLAKNVLGKDLEDQPHREVCGLFVPKDPNRPYTEWHLKKQRLLMIPRGSFKSTLDVVDCVQAIICDPNIRILIVTAALNLAEAFVQELRHYFLVREDVGPTQFQLLFPEFCVSAKVKSLATEFTTPARKIFKKEPTVWASSAGSNLPGWHCDFLKLDDCVNNLNANQDEQISKTVEIYNFARKLVDPGGYIDVIGTPYNPNDLYSYIQKHALEEDLLIYAKPAWKVKERSLKKLRSNEELKEEDYDLFFPSRLTYQFLRKEQRMDPVSFESQYLINSRATAKQYFDETSVRASVIPWRAIPQNVSYYAAWDLGYKTAASSNVTAGPVVAVDQNGRMYVTDLCRGKFSVNELTFHIADTIRRYPLQLTGIEDVNGGQWLEPEINRQAERLGIQSKIYWIPVDRTKDAKFRRIIRLSQLFDQRRLFISDACPHADEIVEQFLNFTGSKSGTDDIIDAISFFPSFIHIYPQEDPNSEEYKRQWEKMKEASFHSLLWPDAPADPQPSIDVPMEPSYNDYF